MTNHTAAHTRYRITTATPIGELTVVADDDAVVAIRWDGEADALDLAGVPLVARGEHPVLDAAVDQLGEYFAGQRTEFDLPLHPLGTPFQLAAWQALRAIPFGETRSYAEQAAAVGDRRKARAVGAANGQNPIPIVVPCHRVVGTNGHLTGFGGGIETKAWLLDHELRVRFG